MMLQYVLSTMEARLRSTERWHHGIQRLLWLMRSDHDPQHRAGAAQEFIQEELDTEDLACLVYYILDPTLVKLEEELKSIEQGLGHNTWMEQINAITVYSPWRESIYQIQQWCRFCVHELEKRNALDDVVLSQDERDLQVRPLLGPKRTKKTYFMNDYIQMPFPQVTLDLGPNEMRRWMNMQVVANPEAAAIRLIDD